MRYLSITVAVVAALFISTLAMAQQYGHGGGHGAGMMMQTYQSLSAEQQASLNSLREEHRKKIMPLVLEVRAKKAELDTLLIASSFDKRKVSALNKEINELHSKIASEDTDFRRKVFELTGQLIGGSGSGMSGMGGMKGKGHGYGGPQPGMRMMMPPNVQTQ